MPKSYWKGQKQVKLTAEFIYQSCVLSQKISIARHSLQLMIPKTTIQNMLHKCLKLTRHKLKLRHENKSTGWSKTS